MNTFMKNENTNKPNFYINHKEYFDQKIIEVLESEHKQVLRLKDKLEISKTTINSKNYLIKSLRFKIKDLKSINYSLKTKYKDSNDIKKEIEKINTIIEGELNDITNENEALRKIIDIKDKKNEELIKENEILRKQNKLYTTKKDSSNSSLCPSSDFASQKKKKKKSDTPKKIGGQLNHPDQRAKLNDSPNEIIEKKVKKAPTGAVPHYDENGHIEYYVTQEIGIDLTSTVKETRYYIDEEAESLEESEMRRNAISPVTYTNDFKAVVLYLNSKGAIALKRLCEMMNQLSNGTINIAPSTIVKWLKEFEKKSESYRSEILDNILASKIVHVDETGWRVNGKQAWMQGINSTEGAYFVVTEKRSDDEKGPINLLEDFEGYLVHDHFKPYYWLENCIHVECNAHIMRYLQQGIDYDDNIGCIKMKKLFMEIYIKKEKLIEEGITQMDDLMLEAFEERLKEIANATIDEYESQNPNMKKSYQPEYIPLMKRLIKYSGEHLMFAKDFNVPFSNNACELQMRKVKAKKKISGQSINIETANTYSAIHTVNQSCSIRNENTVETIKDIIAKEKT